MTKPAKDCCKEWKENGMNTAGYMATLINAWFYSPFNFCPWCGKRRKKGAK